MHVRSPVGMVPRISDICLSTNQSQVRQRLPWFRESRKQRMASCASARDQIPPSARRQVCVQPTWTRSKECHRCAAAAGKFARFTCGYNRLVTPSWALFFVKTPFRSSRASSNMACSRKIVFTLAPTGVSVLRTAACIARFTRCPRRPTTCQKEVEVKSPFIIQYHRAMSAKSQRVRQDNAVSSVIPEPP